MKTQKVLFFGPYSGPITGQSISFQETYHSFKGNKVLVDTTKFKRSKLLNTLYCLFLLPIVFVFQKFAVVYFTCTRSKLGTLKDLELLLLCKLFKKKVVNHLHGADFKSFYNDSGKIKFLITYFYKQIDLSIVLLPSMREQFSDFPNMKIAVIENCYSSAMDGITLDFEAKNKQVLYLSNLIHSKGIFIFLEAAQQLLKEDLDVIIKIAGLPMEDDFMSEKETSLKFQIIYKDLKIKFPDRIFYLGGVLGAEKTKILLESSVFVLPTFYKTEAFPITIIEAMRFGNAIVTTNHNYLSDIINKENGRLIPVNSSSALIENILSLFLNKKEMVAIQHFNVEESKRRYSPLAYNLAISEVINSI